MRLKDARELLRYWGLDPDVAEAEIESRLDGATHRMTDCGAWAHLLTVPEVAVTTERWHLLLGMRGLANEYAYVYSAKRGGRWNDRAGWLLPDEAGVPEDLRDWLTDGTLNRPSWNVPDEVPWAELPDAIGDQAHWPTGWTFRLHKTVLTVTLPVKRETGKMLQGIQFGSIVEGVDQTTEVYTVMFPFDSAEIEQAIQAVEDEAREIWNQTHGCEHCWGGQTVYDDWGNAARPDDFGSRPVDPDCPSCGGQGIII